MYNGFRSLAHKTTPAMTAVVVLCVVAMVALAGTAGACSSKQTPSIATKLLG